MIDYYKVLELNKTASQTEIKQSYRRLAKKYHPDRNNNSEVAVTKFKAMVEAYETLSDPSERRVYDSRLYRASRPKNSRSYTQTKQQEPPAGRYYRQTQQQSTSTAEGETQFEYKKTKHFKDKAAEERFYLTLYPWLAKAALLFILYGFILSFDFVLPSREKTEKVERVYNLWGGSKIEVKLPKNIEELKKQTNRGAEYEVHTDNYIFKTNFMAATLARNDNVTLTSTLVFNTLRKVEVENKRLTLYENVEFGFYAGLGKFIVFLSVILYGLATRTKVGIGKLMLFFFGIGFVVFMSIPILLIVIRIWLS